MNMIGMLMSDQNRIDLMWGLAKPFQSPLCFFECKTKIDQYAGPAIINERAITSTATTERCNAHDLPGVRQKSPIKSRIL
jgi:hypothetical protein